MTDLDRRIRKAYHEQLKRNLKPEVLYLGAEDYDEIRQSDASYYQTFERQDYYMGLRIVEVCRDRYVDVGVTKVEELE